MVKSEYTDSGTFRSLLTSVAMQPRKKHRTTGERRFACTILRVSAEFTKSS
jgi:hypothetical protein